MLCRVSPCLFSRLALIYRTTGTARFVRSYTGKQIQCMKQSYDASVRPKQFEENDEVLLFDPRKKCRKYTKWSVTWIGPFRVQKRFNSCNYVLRKSAKSRPFVVHVDRMRPYLHELDDSDTGKPPLSDASDMQGKSPTSSSQVLDANTPSQSNIAPQSVKAGATARPAAPAVSTYTDRALATDATAAPSTEVIDSITDTDATVADMSGAGPASASQTDKPTGCSDSNFRADLANSAPAVPRARNDDVNVDVANRPCPPQANRPQRSRRVPARLHDYEHARYGGNRVSFGRQSPFCMVVVQNSQRCTSVTEVASVVEMLSHKSETSTADDSSSESSAWSPSETRKDHRR